MTGRQRFQTAIFLAVMGFASSPAAAHHAMGGKLPTSFLEGLLSGLGHPVIGADHLAFIVAIGIAAALVPAGARLIAAFIAASTAGVMVHLGAVNIPLSEALVAGSVVVAGLMIATGGASGRGWWLALATIAGFLHGYAFGESIVGADKGVLGAYLVGLALITAAVAFGVRAVAHALAWDSHGAGRSLRTAGVALGSVGVVLLAASLVIV